MWTFNPALARTANHAHRFLVNQCSAASLTVAVSMYLQVTSATSRQNRIDRRSCKVARTRPPKLSGYYINICRSVLLARPLAAFQSHISWLSVDTKLQLNDRTFDHAQKLIAIAMLPRARVARIVPAARKLFNCGQDVGHMQIACGKRLPFC